MITKTLIRGVSTPDKDKENTLEMTLLYIDFSAFVRKNKYLSIQLTNSVKNIITVKNNRIASSKKSGSIHGTGLKSIKRVVKKYDGEINMNFNEDDMTFTSNVVFEISRLNYEY